jgi:transposase
MAKQDKYGLRKLRSEFPNDGACLEYLFTFLHTKECSCGGEYTRLKDRKQYQCSKCRFQIAPMASTIFEKSSTPLTLWFHAIFIFSNAKSGISAKEMEHQLNVTYKTAWRLLMLIRKALRGENRGYIGGGKSDVEIDGSPNNANLSMTIAKKTPIIAAIQRKGPMKALKVPDFKADTMAQFLDHHVDPMGTRLLTDASKTYVNSAWGYERESVNHRAKEYVRGDVYTNTVESFWAHFKRSIAGTHKAVSKKHLQAYLDGFVFHRNNRHSDRERFGALLEMILSA